MASFAPRTRDAYLLGENWKQIALRASEKRQAMPLSWSRRGIVPNLHLTVSYVTYDVNRPNPVRRPGHVRATLLTPNYVIVPE